MKDLARTFASIVLAFGIAIAGFGQAGAHGAGAHSMIICSGNGLVRITLAPDGTPVKPTVPCPDCVLSLVALAPPADVIITTPLSVRVVPLLQRAVWIGTPAGLWAEGRSPPSFV